MILLYWGCYTLLMASLALMVLWERKRLAERRARRVKRTLERQPERQEQQAAWARQPILQ